MGNDDKLLEMKVRLDLLVSIYRDELGGLRLAETLYATANGLAAMEGEHPRWLAEEQVLEVPFTQAGALEESLESLLSMKVICLQVKGDVPMLTNIRVRVKAASMSVELAGRAVQNTAAGIVVQLQDATVDVQRALVGLPGILRSNPTKPLKMDKVTVRMPDLIPSSDAEEKLFPTPAQPALPAGGFAMERTIVDAPPIAALSRVRDPERAAVAEPARETPSAAAIEERVRMSRLKLQVPKIQAAVDLIGKRNHFDFLGVHFSSSLRDVSAARERMLTLIAQCRDDDIEGELTNSLDRLVSRLHDAWTSLQTQSARQEHRLEHVGRFQIETTIETYDGQADAAKMTGRPEIAVDCYRRIVELQPTHRRARNELLALQDYVDD